MRGFNQLFAHILAGSTLAAPDPADIPAGVVPGVVPTAPGPSDVFNEGTNCTIKWNPDPAGLWKETNVQLMTGDNFNMIHITTVATFDGTDAATTEFSYPCPDVEPNSAIYFYQFSTSAAPRNLTWTTRFTIADADGQTTPPANDTQPDNQKIPWGVGALVDPSKATPPPSYLVAGGESSPSSPSSPSSSPSSSSSSTPVSLSPTPSSEPSGNGSGNDSGNGSGSGSGAGPTTENPPQQTGNTQNQNGDGSTGAGGDNGALSAQANVVAGALAMCLTAVVFGVMS